MRKGATLPYQNKGLMVQEKKTAIRRLKEPRRAGRAADLNCTINRRRAMTRSDDKDRSSLQKHRLMRRWAQRRGLATGTAPNRIPPIKLEKFLGHKNPSWEEAGEGRTIRASPRVRGQQTKCLKAKRRRQDV